VSSPPASRDRRELLLAQGAKWNGIDYVEVAADQRTLYVHFLNDVAIAGTLEGAHPVTIDGGEVIAQVSVAAIEASAFSADEQGRPVLELNVAAPGDFSTYRLTIASSALDHHFASAPFSFKVGCPTELDCQAPPPGAPAEPGEQVTIDYLAKDFASFTRALSEFSAGRYPAWVERSEADLAVVLMEALAALADELSYLQDRVSAEASIATATQRLSMLRHARLVDYEPAPATVATTYLALEVSEAATITTPLHFRAVAADGGTVDFEIGEGLLDERGAARTIAFLVDQRWNRSTPGSAMPPSELAPYWWDDSEVCLPAGAGELYVVGKELGLRPGQQLLLDTAGSDSAEPHLRELVTLSEAPGRVPRETRDPLLEVSLTQLFLAAPTTLEHDLRSTTVAGNIVPAIQGLRTTEYFYIPGAPPPDSDVTPAPCVVRVGANWTPEDPLPDYRHCLSQNPLAWVAGGEEDGDTTAPARPELILTEETSPSEEPRAWHHVRWLLAGEEGEPCFTLTPERYSPVLSAGGRTFFDYDGDDASTIRFGEGEFGAAPAPGTLFRVVYRVGGGAIGNVPADTIVGVVPEHGVPEQTQSELVLGCTNPFPASGGAEAETLAQIANRAPQKFAAELLRVVQPGDYVAAAQSLPFVKQAGTSFRWTGSWLTVFTAADPSGTEEPAVEQLEKLTELLDQRRLAGYESYVLPPRYVSIDLWLVVCAQPTQFAADVEQAVLQRLRPGALPGGGYGFFDHSQWGFGQPLEPSALFAAVQGCAGVAGVYEAQYRQRGVQLEWSALPEAQPLTFAADEILRIDDDPSRPEAGSLSVIVQGGK
jgi:hypothetical protein